MIWKEMYVEDEPIRLYPNPDNNLSWDDDDIDYPRSHILLDGLPKDLSRYLSAPVVSEEISREIAKTFYGHNTFVMNEKILTTFGEQDHYSSSVTPYELVRKLEIRLQCWETGQTRVPNNVALVTHTNRYAEAKERNQQILGVLRRFKSLRELNLTVDISMYIAWDARMIANTVMDLKSRNIHVVVQLTSYRRSRSPLIEDIRDVTNFFDPPTAEDKKLFASEVPRTTCFVGDNVSESSDDEAGDQDICRLNSLRVPLPCLGGSCKRACLRQLSWQAGWYRGFLDEYREVSQARASQADVETPSSPVRLAIHFNLEAMKERDFEYYNSR